jgi:hypothetical protein
MLEIVTWPQFLHSLLLGGRDLPAGRQRLPVVGLAGSADAPPPGE